MPAHPQERNRKACDKCHQQKLSCKKIGGGDECERCHRLKRPCTSSPPLRNQRNSTTRRNPREHDGGRRRPKTLAILPRSSTPAAVSAATTSTTAAGIPLTSYSCSESGSSSSYSHDQDTTASVIPVMPDQLVVETMDEHQQQQHQPYMEPICWSGRAGTADELSSAAYPPYFAPCWPDGEEMPRIDHMVGGRYPDRPSASPPHHFGPIQTAASVFPDLDRDMDAARDDDVPPPPPPGAHLAHLQQPIMGTAPPPITSLDTRDPAGIRDDLGPYACYPTTTTTHPIGFGPGYVQYSTSGYGPGSRVRFDWQPVVCMEPAFQGGLT